MAKFKIWVTAALVSTFLVLGVVGAPAACGDKADDQGDCGNATTASGLDTVPESVNGTGTSSPESQGGGVVDDAEKESVPLQDDHDAGAPTNARDEVYKMLYETFSFPESVELNAFRTPWRAKERKEERREKRSFQELTYRTFEPGAIMAPSDSSPAIRRIRAISSKGSPTPPPSLPEDLTPAAFRSFQVPVDRERWRHHLEFKARTARLLRENAHKQAAERKHKEQVESKRDQTKQQPQHYHTKPRYQYPL